MRFLTILENKQKKDLLDNVELNCSQKYCLYGDLFSVRSVLVSLMMDEKLVSLYGGLCNSYLV